jgi:hypothetical protein
MLYFELEHCLFVAVKVINIEVVCRRPPVLLVSNFSRHRQYFSVDGFALVVHGIDTHSVVFLVLGFLHDSTVAVLLCLARGDEI